MNKKFILIAISISLLSACHSGNRPYHQNHNDLTHKHLIQNEHYSIGDNSQNSLNWQGTYQGITPCASCEGISYILKLNKNNRFQLTSKYLGEKDGDFNEHGIFHWNKTGSQISLSNGLKFQVGENQLFMLDSNGKKVTGELAADYILKKSDEN